MGDRDLMLLALLALTGLGLVGTLTLLAQARRRVKTLTQKVHEVRHHNTGLQHDVARLTRQLARANDSVRSSGSSGSVSAATSVHGPLGDESSSVS